MSHLPPSNPDLSLPNPDLAKSPGRPRALDDTKLREICALISAGCGIEGAARYVGCAASTIRREASRNRDFNERLRRASLSSELSVLNAIRQAAQKYWRAGAWLLERLDVERYGKKKVGEITPEQMADLVHMLVTAISQEFPGEEAAQRIVAKMDDILEHMAEERRAVRNPTKPIAKKRNRETPPWPAGPPSSPAQPAD